MLQRDYLVQLITQFIEAIIRSRTVAGKEDNPLLAADLLEAAVEQALDMDGVALLSLAPESFAAILSVSGVDPALIEYIAHALQQESEYLEQAESHELAQLRLLQAQALFDTYGLNPQNAEIQAEFEGLTTQE